MMGATLLFILAFQTSSPAAMVDRYLATVRPIDVGVGAGLCLAVDPTNPQGVWWWQPGSTGCTSRSTGPGVFLADSARVAAASPSGGWEVSFRVPMHSSARPFVEVRLIIDGGMMRDTKSGKAVAVQRRRDLEIPEKAGRF